MKKAQQEDLIISELLENIENIKIANRHKYGAADNVYCLNDFYIYKIKTIDHKFASFLVWFMLAFISIGFYTNGYYFLSGMAISIGSLCIIYVYLYRHNVYVYSQSEYKKYFSRKNQKQIRSIIMQVETKNILSSIKN